LRPVPQFEAIWGVGKPSCDTSKNPVIIRNVETLMGFGIVSR
jgi:hypothetical protein